MMMGRRGFRKGFTLLETLIYSAVFALVAVSTLRVVGDARVVRSNARDRSVMALLAQSEMERVRSLPPDSLTEERREITSPDWPEGVLATVETRRRADGTWLLDITVRRESIEGKPSVRLTTILPGGDA